MVWVKCWYSVVSEFIFGIYFKDTFKDPIYIWLCDPMTFVCFLCVFNQVNILAFHKNVDRLAGKDWTRFESNHFSVHFSFDSLLFSATLNYSSIWNTGFSELLKDVLQLYYVVEIHTVSNDDICQGSCFWQLL